MTIEEMHIMIDQEVQSMGAFVSDDFEPEEIDLRLNTAMLSLIDEIFTTALSLGFEAFQRRLDEIESIIVSTNLTGKQVLEGKVKYDLPSNYKHNVELVSTIDCGAKKVVSPIRLVSNRIINRLLVNKFHTTNWESPLATMSEKKVLVYTKPDFAVDTVTMTYCREPIRMNLEQGIDCELSETMKLKIVKEAASSIMKIVEQNQQKIVNLETDKLQ
jgi:hypothetical protein